ncbi:MAG TPA: pca operon transcription factor PcaQ [Devosia sp.]|nr:pca operon transcription factor PcaQ [Devosia sp.]
MIDPRIKLRHLACFLEVARLKSVGNAAQSLNISQPAASKTIQELEELLGASLFDRSHRSLSLTAYGEVFYRYAGTSLASLRQGIDAAGEARADPIVKVGALPSVSARILPPAVRAFLRDNLGARSRVLTGPNDYLLSLLRTGDVDLVIGRMAEPDEMLGLSFEHLYSEPVVMVVRPGHPLLQVPRFNLALIEDYPTLMPTPDSVIRPLVQKLLLAHGVTNLRDEVETVSTAFGRSFTRLTDAVWIISEGVVAEDIENGWLVELPFATVETLGPVGLTTRTDTAPSLAGLAFIQAVRDAAATQRQDRRELHGHRVGGGVQ